MDKVRFGCLILLTYHREDCCFVNRSSDAVVLVVAVSIVGATAIAIADVGRFYGSELGLIHQ